MRKPTTPEQAREIASKLFFPSGYHAYSLRSLADQVEALTAERDAYEKCADTMAAAHKVERDALKDAARLALDALVDLKGIRMNEVGHLSVLHVIAALKAVL